MNTSAISSAEELKIEIARLVTLEKIQGNNLKNRFNGPRAIISTTLTLFPKFRSNANLSTDRSLPFDISKFILKLLVPYLLNKTIFKKSSIWIKIFVSSLSQKLQLNFKDINTNCLFKWLKNVGSKPKR